MSASRAARSGGSGSSGGGGDGGGGGASGEAAGRLYPRALALVSRRDDTLDIASVTPGWCCSTSGVIAEAALDELGGSQAGGGESASREAATGAGAALLDALGVDHPLRGAIDWLRDAPSLPLDAASALRLEGFDTLFLELTGNCNERCLHCYANASPQVRAALSQKTCEAVIDDGVALGFRRVQLTGGDPLLCRFLPELLEYGRAAGVPSLEIYTNGLLLSEPLLARVAPARPDLAFSFYSHDAAVHDAITRTPNSQSRTVAAIRRAVDAGLATRVSIVTLPLNEHDIDETVAFVEQLGVASVAVATTRPVGRGDELAPVAAETVATVEGAYDDGPGSTEAAPSDDDTRWPVRGKLCVTYEGDVVPCIFNREDVLGSVTRRPLREIVAAPRRATSAEVPASGDTEALGSLIDRCGEQLQCAGCRLTALALRHGLAPR